MDAALVSNDQLKNLIYVGSVIVDIDTADKDLTAIGIIDISEQYISAVVHNNTSANFKTDTAVHSVVFTPLADEIQA